MKTPEEIKKGLEYCSTQSCCSDECPYYSDERCKSATDALTYIQQLEAGIDRVYQLAINLKDLQISEFIRKRFDLS